MSVVPAEALTSGLGVLPAPLRDAVKQRLQALGEALSPLRDPLALDWLGRLARVFAASEFAAQAATRDPAEDYRALVCVYLYGGNDSFNMVAWS